MKKKLKLGLHFFLLLLLPFVNVFAQKMQSDNGDGTYTNPVIYSDFPDLLIQIYLYSFNPKTKIPFSILKDSFVKLKLFDMLGKNFGVLISKINYRQENIAFHEMYRIYQAELILID